MYPKCIILHLSRLNNICQSSDQLYNFLRSALNFAKLISEPTLQKSLVSSANLSILSHILFSISFINITNSIGPRTEPWVTPLLTSDQLEHLPLITTLCFLSLSHYSIQFATRLPIPMALTFSNSLPCGTLSNAFWKSKNITSIFIYIISNCLYKLQ